ncbi:hypothetical protein SZ64_17850 [Erythrobacter sp. SG61-1L]|uniref:hypothetical protein n=1 Tax=Erythrobacter sp. SG61-1L TaxID=1603897 RepID=UPI0006C926E6|nr:hypothetical protein [Erythrobacter sp. SG61-1L]KPL69749.1 hypothetical protein SZ64_17595 [Erythrobacter sp. SG61-1L]KPL69798.1 hypothetical protein SZ64_17850 [Erythrobacter sp. SG61-1L]
MGFGTVLVLIVLICAIAGTMSSRYRAQAGIGQDSSGNQFRLGQQNEALEREVAELRERVKVLERIATDSHTGSGRDARAIAAEIESLRSLEAAPKGDA